MLPVVSFSEDLAAPLLRIMTSPWSYYSRLPLSYNLGRPKKNKGPWLGHTGTWSTG